MAGLYLLSFESHGVQQTLESACNRLALFYLQKVTLKTYRESESWLLVVIYCVNKLDWIFFFRKQGTILSCLQFSQ